MRINMKVRGKHYRTVWHEGHSVFLIEQNLLPFEFSVFEAKTYRRTCHAISTMIVRGAGAIGCAAGFAMAQAAAEAPQKNYQDFLKRAKSEIEKTRPTAQNLFDATQKVFESAKQSAENAWNTAQAIADNDAQTSQLIGEHGSVLIKNNMAVATHCNAGWLAFADYGTALSPIYVAHNRGRKVIVYVDETRPRSQGARLTAWELQQAGIEHIIIPDNATAWLMMQGKIQLMITGADRIARNGDTANKIGTLEKAIVAKTLGVPFYIAAPTTTIDFDCPNGRAIPIEYRSPDEVLFQTGPNADNQQQTIRVASPGSTAINPAFDVTPAKFITGFITEKGIVKANDIAKLKT